MGLFGRKKIQCPKGEWTTLIANFGSGMPATFRIEITARDGECVRGSYTEKRHWWIFPQSPVTGEISEKMRFQRYWINAIYSVKICPEADVVAEID